MGQVLLGDRDISQTSAHDRVKLGIVLCRERHPVFPDSTVMENLRVAGHLRKKAEVDEALVLVFDLFPNLTRWTNQQSRVPLRRRATDAMSSA